MDTLHILVMDKGIFHTWWIRLSKLQYLLQRYCNLYDNNNETIHKFSKLFNVKKSVVHFYHAGIVMRCGIIRETYDSIAAHYRCVA